MKIIKLLGSVLLMAFGACMVVYGGYDDSPGGQMLGLVAIIGGIVGIVRTLRKTSS